MMTNKKIEVVIADDHELLRIGIRNLLERSPNISVIGEASNGKEAISLVGELCPDVLILDLHMPVMDGFEALDFLNREKADVIILVLSANNDKAIISEVISKGAWGYYLKEEGPEKIVEAVHQAGNGNGKAHHSEVARSANGKSY